MLESSRPGEVDFPAARNQIEKEIEEYLHSAGISTIEIPSVQLEKGDIRFSFSPSDLDRSAVYDALLVIKSSIENVRVHTFEQGYVVFQSMGKNLFETKNFSSGTKFKFMSIGSQNKVEVSRTGNFDQNEIQACVQLFRLFYPVQKTKDPAARLGALGVSVYRPDDEKKAAWSDISGYETTKREVQESVIFPLRHPEMFLKVSEMARPGNQSGNLPRAILFEGPPGVGKTTMARIVAHETNIPLVYVPIENILSKYYGESAQNMAAIFDAAAEFQSVILFLDEIDSLAGSREDGLFEATRRVLSVLLRKIDGFEGKTGVITIGATNRSGDLDPALLSRFDQTLHFPLPDEAEREAIFAHYASHLQQSERKEMALTSRGYSGRNIQDVCGYAERRWARQLILSGEKPSAPPAALYLEILKKRKEDAAQMRQ